MYCFKIKKTEKLKSHANVVHNVPTIVFFAKAVSRDLREDLGGHASVNEQNHMVFLTANRLFQVLQDSVDNQKVDHIYSRITPPPHCINRTLAVQHRGGAYVGFTI
jgi:hypothetical protein